MADNKPGVGAYVRDQDADAAISELSKNKTLMVAKLTSDPAMRPEVVSDLTNVEQVFEHFKPKCEVEFEGEDGSEVKEEMSFKNLGNFGRKGITKQSAFLQDLDAQQVNYQKFLKQLKSNKILQSMLADPDAKAGYIETLKTMLEELQGSGPSE